MKKKSDLFLAVFFPVLLYSNLFANDGAYYSYGGSFYPVQETRIEMRKEHLSFTRAGNLMQVHVRFEFYNPEAKEIKIPVGFQAWQAQGDVRGDSISHPQIYNFRVMQEGELLPWQLNVTECEDCPLKSPQELQLNHVTYGLYVFLFEATFKPGITVISHSYTFPASSDVERDELWFYILSTGGKWAGGAIQDFTAEIYMGDHAYFYVNEAFGSSAQWNIAGTGKIDDDILEGFGEARMRMVNILSGKLVITAQNMRPVSDIEIGVWGEGGYFHPAVPNECPAGHLQRCMNLLTLESDPREPFTLTAEDLRILRNYPYARHGYSFSDPDLRKFFSAFFWYLPDPNMRMEDIRLTEEEQAFVDEIRRREKNESGN